jgi:hypothetical protein
VVTPKRTATPKTITSRQAVTPKRVVTPKAITPKGTAAPKRVVTPRVATPKGVTPKVASPPPLAPLGLRAIGARRTGQTAIHGRNYTVWRGAHRVRHRDRWVTLAAISALSVVVFGDATYHPYAYISATGPYCEGFTEDGCILQWEEVWTLEGPRVFQCVAYCPWQ